MDNSIDPEAATGLFPAGNVLRLHLKCAASYRPLGTVRAIPPTTMPSGRSRQSYDRFHEQLNVHVLQMTKAYRYADAILILIGVYIGAMILYLVATGQLNDGECTQSNPCPIEGKHIPLIASAIAVSILCLFLMYMTYRTSKWAEEDIVELCEETSNNCTFFSSCKLKKEKVKDSQKEEWYIDIVLNR